MRTRQERPRAAATAYGGEPVVAAVPLRKRSTLLGIPVAIAAAWFLVVGGVWAMAAAAVTLAMLAVLALRSEYAEVLALSSDGHVALHRRGVLAGRVRTTLVPPADLVLPTSTGLGLRRLTVRGRARWAQPIFDSELHSFAQAVSEPRS